MKPIVKKLMMTIMVACMCVCMCQERVQASVTSEDTMLVYRGQSNYGTKPYYRTSMNDYDALVYPNNGVSAYSNYVNVHLVRKDSGAINHCTESEICSSNRVIELSYYAGKITTSKPYYLAASLFPSATVSYKYFTYRMIP